MVTADGRAGVERLCRYVPRPPVAQERLSLTPDGLVVVTLKAEGHDGTTHLLFTPVELLEKLAALTLRPPDQPGAAPRHPGTPGSRTSARGGPRPGHSVTSRSGEADTASTPSRATADGGPVLLTAGHGNDPGLPEKPRNWRWADLMRRVFDLVVLSCPRCGGRMSVIATIDAADVLRKILGHLGLPTDRPLRCQRGRCHRSPISSRTVQPDRPHPRGVRAGVPAGQ